MSNPDISPTLLRVAAETLEGIALLSPLPEEEAPKLPNGPRKLISVAFTGPVCGVLIIEVSEGVLEEVAAAMLALEAGVSPSGEQKADVLSELANVMCGNLLPVVAGREPVFHLGAPDPDVTEGVMEACGALPVARARLWLNSGTMDLTLAVDEPSFFTDGTELSPDIQPLPK